jgi:hypothetical protein
VITGRTHAGAGPDGPPAIETTTGEMDAYSHSSYQFLSMEAYAKLGDESCDHVADLREC